MAQVLTFNAALARKPATEGTFVPTNGQLVGIRDEIDPQASSAIVAVRRATGKDGLLDPFNRNRQQA